MAHDWIKVRKCLRDHPKIVRVASALRADRARIIGALFLVWSIADEHTVDGRLDGYTAEAIDHAVGLEGFAAATAAVGWLILEAEAVVIPDFMKHNGQSAKRRAQETNRKNNARKASSSDADKTRPRSDQIREELDIDRSDRCEFFEAGGVNPVFVDDAIIRAALPEAQKVADLVRVGPALSAEDEDTVMRCVIIAQQRLPRGKLKALMRSNSRAFDSKRIPSKIGYFKKSIINACSEAGVDFHFVSKFDLPRRDVAAAQAENVA